MEFPDIPEYESEVEFSCEPGFVLNGPTVSTCTSHGNWTEKPVCDRIRK